MTDSETSANPSRKGLPARIGGGLRRHWISAGLATLVLLAGGAFVWNQVEPLVSTKYRSVTYTVPSAPRLVASSGERVFRVDPGRSSFSYSIGEKIAGASRGTATGSTSGIAGDVALNTTDPQASRVGDIVVNVEQLHSDNRLRDARIRQDFLESHTHPLATFSAAELTGMPTQVVEGKTYRFTMSGKATVKQTTAPVTWDVEASVQGNDLTVTATTKAKLSTFDVGPISIAGLVSTTDDVTLTLKLVAADPAKARIPTEVTGPDAISSKAGGPSFKNDIQPVLASSCASCHNPGQVGAAHWVLEKASDASSIAEGIKTITEAKYMPPWPASDKGVPLAHVKSLDPATIALLGAWADHGGKLDVPAETEIKPSAEQAAAQPRHDITMKMPESYTGSLSNPNDYRCFVLDPGVTEPTFMTGYTFMPDQIEEIHHAQIFHISAAQKASGLKRSGADGKPGWSCYSGPGLRGQSPTGGLPRVRDAGFAGQDSLIAGWAPGQEPVTYADKAGILLQPGEAVVLQIHYHFENAPTPDRSSMALQIAPGTAKLNKVRIVNPLAPVEIPCMPGETAELCNRAAAIKDNVRLYGQFGASTESGLLMLCGQTPAGLTEGFKGVASSSCTQRVPQDGTIVGLMGHMHTLGKSVRLTLDDGKPEAKILLDIPVWNFDWQMNYTLATPLHVTTDQTIRIDCSWDRSLDPNRAPKYIVFAEGTEDEMCFGTYALIPDKQN